MGNCGGIAVRLVILAFIFEIQGSYQENNTIRLGYMTGSARYPGSNQFYKRPGQAISGALTFAVDEINADTNVLPNHTLEFIIAETYGLNLQSIQRTVDLVNENISAYIGPQETCTHEGKIAAAFNLAMISYVSIQFTLAI